MPRLTSTFVEREVGRQNDSNITIYRDDLLQGFGLRVTKGSISYICETRVNGKNRRLTIGRHPLISAEEARKKALVILGKMAQGVDPVAEKEKQRMVNLTLGQAFTEYMQSKDFRPNTIYNQITS